MENLLKEILSEIKGIKGTQEKMQSEITGIKDQVAGIKGEVSGIKETQENMQSDIIEIKEKVNAVYNQTADLTEFRTESIESLNQIKDDVEYLTHKESQNEKVLFNLQRKVTTNR